MANFSESKNLPHRLVLFDGVCNLCNGTVQFIIERDPDSRFHFSALQSDIGQNILKKNDLETENFESFLYFREGILYQKSSAAIRMLGDLGGFWKLMRGFLIVPKFIRDAVYSFIAKNRYRWFGKQESCWLPTPDLQARFL